MITKAVKVSQVEAVDGKTPMTGKQSTQEKAVWNKTFQGQSFSIHGSVWGPERIR